MLSSDDLKPQLTRLQELGLDAYLMKPITRKDLFQAIRRVIDNARNLQESRFATRQDGLIDQDISHWCYGPHIRKHNADKD